MDSQIHWEFQETREEVGARRKKWLAYSSEEHRRRLERERLRRAGK